MPQSPVDITQFRNAIGHDAGVERMLLGLFLETSDGAVERLRAAATAQAWEAELHLLKGAAANVGAARLAELAREGQRLGDAPAIEKQRFMELFLSAYAEVRDYIAPLAR